MLEFLSKTAKLTKEVKSHANGLYEQHQELERERTPEACSKFYRELGTLHGFAEKNIGEKHPGVVRNLEVALEYCQNCQKTGNKAACSSVTNFLNYASI